MNNDNKFIYNYSAKEQKEVEQLRDKYLPKKENALTQMRKLDQKVCKKASIMSITIGFLSSLVFGIGMSCTMVWQETLFFPGIIIGSIGLLGICITMPLYQHILKTERTKIADQMLTLSKTFEQENRTV